MKTLTNLLINKFYSTVISKIKKDDLLHSYICTILTLMISELSNIMISIIVVSLVALSKEIIIDKMIRDNKISVRDLIADSIGIIIGLLLL